MWKKGYDKLNRKDGEESLRKFVEKENIMQKILITNDDGIQSDGIIRLARAAKKYGKVWVVAPDGQRSAMSHRITLRETIEFFPVDFPVEGVHAYASTGILVAGEPTFFVSIQAWEKAKMYIENGTEDDILFYIDGYREHIEKGKQQKGTVYI